jgi:hypothetical protein
MPSRSPTPIESRVATRLLTIVAQDPSVRAGGRILRAKVAVPAETLHPGPQGHRVHVIDYDGSNGTQYRPRRKDLDADVLERKTDAAILHSPEAHAQNVYAIVMSVLALFEAALGRRVAWGFAQRGHQLKLVPHAFAEANAFYSRRDEALLFGYFPSERRQRETVFTCLSHDIVAHETTHALLDGLRNRYTEPSSPDQAAFHEGFADVVALLSVFRLSEVIEHTLGAGGGRTLPRSAVGHDALLRSTLFHLAEEMGRELSPLGRREALRRSASLDPRSVDLDSDEYLEPHRRGEVFVAAMIHAFVEVWVRRLDSLLGKAARVSLAVASEEGTTAARHLLAMAIRALDYCPPVDLQFGDFLSALLTADREVVPDDAPHHYRAALCKAFAAFGIGPAVRNGGYWDPPGKRMGPAPPSFRNCHFEAMKRDPDEMFRFVWENRKALELDPDAYTYVASVRPSQRLGPDGIVLQETVAEYVQILDLRARELGALGIARPSGMPADQPVRLYGGGALLFDDFGRLKFHVGSGVRSRRKQSKRLAYLWTHGGLRGQAAPARRFALLHLQRSLGAPRDLQEAW